MTPSVEGISIDYTFQVKAKLPQLKKAGRRVRNPEYGDPAGKLGDNQVSLSCRIEFRRTGQPDSTGGKQTAESEYNFI